MKLIDRIALILLIIGGLNWGSIGIFNFDIVSFITGDTDILKTIIFTIVGLCAVWCISLLFRSREEIE